MRGGGGQPAVHLTGRNLRRGQHLEVRLVVRQTAEGDVARALTSGSTTEVVNFALTDRVNRGAEQWAADAAEVRSVPEHGS